MSFFSNVAYWIININVIKSHTKFVFDAFPGVLILDILLYIYLKYFWQIQSGWKLHFFINYSRLTIIFGISHLFRDSSIRSLTAKSFLNWKNVNVHVWILITF